MKKKPFYKGWWFWFIILAILLCVGNILLAHFKKDVGSNIFTAVSGWVSGVATIILGVIAVVQNRKYKVENDRYLKEQRQINDYNIQEQKDLEWRKTKSTVLQLVLNEFIGVHEEFQLFGDIKTNLLNVAYSKDNIEKLKGYYAVTAKFQNVGLKIIFILKYSPQYFEWYEDLYEIISNYNKLCLNLMNEIKNNANEQSDISKLILERIDTINELNENYYEINTALPVYELIIENDIADIFEKDFNILKNYYKNLEVKKQQWQKFIKEEEAKNNG